MDINNCRDMCGLEKDQKVDKKTPSHGAAYSCQRCGYTYDDCECNFNLLIELCEKIEKLQLEKDKYKTALESLHFYSCSACEDNRDVMEKALRNKQ